MQKKHLVLVGVFVLAFALAFALAWAILRPEPAPVPPAPETPLPARTVAAAEMAEYLRMIGDNDFAGLRRVGEELFAAGNRVPGARELLAEHETTSYSPEHFVYALFHHVDRDKVYRVFLTLDGEERVVSFLAEDMNIAR